MDPSLFFPLPLCRSPGGTGGTHRRQQTHPPHRRSTAAAAAGSCAAVAAAPRCNKWIRGRSLAHVGVGTVSLCRGDVRRPEALFRPGQRPRMRGGGWWRRLLALGRGGGRSRLRPDFLMPAACSVATARGGRAGSRQFRQASAAPRRCWLLRGRLRSSATSTSGGRCRRRCSPRLVLDVMW